MILNIFKIGGSIVDNVEWLEAFAQQISIIDGPRIIIHGGGNTASKICGDLGIEVKMHQGRRITDEETLKVMIMVYGGSINKSIVAHLQSHGVNAAGLSGADGNTILAHKRLPSTFNDNVDYGFAGDIDIIDPAYLISMLQNNLVPVIAPLSHDGNGQLLNTNADTTAAHISAALAASFEVRLVYLLDHPGVMKDVNDVNSIISVVDLSEINNLKEQQLISDGMIPKLDNAGHAIRSGVAEVYLSDIASLSQLGEGKGTRVISTI